MAKTKDTLSTASVLAFERKLDPSDALFSAGPWSERAQGASWAPVGVREKSVRGTISNRLKTKDQDPAKLDAAIENPNLQTVDVATLPSNADTLRVRFTLRVLPGVGRPSACNSADYQAQLLNTVQGYVAGGFDTLARRYAANLANGRFLWRNRIGAESIEVQVSRLQEGQAAESWRFQALDFSLNAPDVVPAGAEADLNALAGVIAAALAGPGHALLEVVAYVRLGDGQEIYPSQELILDKGDKKGQRSKTLYVVEQGEQKIAALHSQKVGNALRTIDTWYPSVEDQPLVPIAVEPYGSVTNQGKAYRQPKQKVDFYSLLDSWVLKGEAPKNADDQHFVMAVLIRGGVFGDSDKE
ncbi:type I-F CRISPR-associated protein Csy3 [Zoogloea sp.]|uniref:type I-F CRISPR-associated protein Csy3 n=1 Tax=Zoogloea sp. TaxID=49181 RepID=UPI0035AEB6BE